MIEVIQELNEVELMEEFNKYLELGGVEFLDSYVLLMRLLENEA